jgi:hypothetical protein
MKHIIMLPIYILTVVFTLVFEITFDTAWAIRCFLVGRDD